MEGHCRILLAVESGSRAWGFPSPDSDYDVRFIYVRPIEHYLKLEQNRDVIELPINDLLDMNGWDLKKALCLLHRSNPTYIRVVLFTCYTALTPLYSNGSLHPSSISKLTS